MLDKEKNDVYDLKKVIEYLPIQRGGGTGPMKPGNQRMHGANTCDIFAMMGFNVIINLVVRRGFFVINVRDYS
jgi:hypothetical protein